MRGRAQEPLAQTGDRSKLGQSKTAQRFQNIRVESPSSSYRLAIVAGILPGKPPENDSYLYNLRLLLRPPVLLVGKSFGPGALAGKLR